MKKLILVLFIAVLATITILPHFKGENDGEKRLNLTKTTEKVVLDSYIEILEDKKRAYTIEEITAGQYDHQFMPYIQQGRPNLGYTRSAYWVRFQVDNESSQQDWKLEVDTPKTNQIILYTPEGNGKFDEEVVGNKLPFAERDMYHRNFIYDIEIEPEQTKTYYLRFTTGSSMQIPLTIWSPSAFGEKSQIEYSLFGMVFGICFVMALYNLFLYFSIGDRSYLYYVLFVFFNSLLYLSDTGLAYQFLWPEQISMNLRAVIMFICFGNIGGLLFTRSFLEIYSSMPRFDHLFKLLMVFNLIVIVCVQFTFTGAVYAAVLCVILLIVLIMIAAFISLRKGYRPARFFTVAWSIFLLGVLTSILVDAGAMPLTLFTKYAWQVTTTLEVVLLSFALGDKYKTIREEKEQAVQEANRNQKLALEALRRADELKKEINESLEKKVQDRTAELKVMNEQLQTAYSDLQKMEHSRSELLSNITHELGTPITLIQGYIQAVKEGLVQDNNEHYLKMIHSKLLVLNRLTGDLFDLAKLKSGKIQFHFQQVSLTNWLKYLIPEVELDVIHSGRRFIDPEINYESVHLDLMLIVDMERMNQVFLNINENAKKYTGECDGEIGMAVEILTEDGMDPRVLISLSDNGDGIAAEELPFIFDRYFHSKTLSTRKDTKGTGLGLAIAKEIVRSHHGNLWVESELGEGSTFYISLPVVFESKDMREGIS